METMKYLNALLKRPLARNYGGGLTDRTDKKPQYKGFVSFVSELPMEVTR